MSKKKIEILIQKLDEDAIIPVQMNQGDAGFDLYSDEDVLIHAYDRELVHTGIAVEIQKAMKDVFVLVVEMHLIKGTRFSTHQEPLILGIVVKFVLFFTIVQRMIFTLLLEIVLLNWLSKKFLT